MPRTAQAGAALRRSAGALLLAAASAAPAATLEPSAGNYFGAGLIVVQPGSERGADDGTGAGLVIAGPLGERRWWEARVFSNVLDTGSRTAIDFYQTGLGVDILQPLGPVGGSHLFALMGGGVTINDVDPSSDSGTGGYVNAAVGWRGSVWQSWGVRPRLEVRTLYDSFNGGQTDVQMSFMLEIPPHPTRIVEKTVEVQKTVEVPVEVIKIVEKPVVCVVPPVETAAVAPASTTLDADGDGIPDAQDLCPETLAGAEVGLDGCVRREQSINLPNIEFEPGSAVLTRGGRDKLEPVAAFLQNQAGVRMEVVGHTDAQGADAYNQKLSEDRARAVLQHLTGQGIAADRLTPVGAGESEPIAPNDTATGRATNRRVELRIRAGE